MMKFDHAEYLKNLAASEAISDCELVPVPKCAEHQNYIFISYSHKDYKKVYHDLAQMYHSGVRFWYDKELTAGKEWDDEVFCKISDPHCSGVVFYISDDFFSSKAVYQEILTTLGRNKKLGGTELEKNYFCVNLASKKPSKLIDENVVCPDNLEGELDTEKLKALFKEAFKDTTTYISHSSKGYMERLLVQIRRNFNVIDLTGDDASLVGDYKGEMLNGKRTGYGTCVYSNGQVYEGEWKENKYHGKGKLTYPDGDSRAYLEGTFVEHKANGHCVFRFRNGDCYTGNMTDGQVTGHFTYEQANGYTYVGDMVAGQRHGKGKLVYPEESKVEYCEGEWKGNNLHGKGFMKFKAGDWYEGEFASSQYCGMGKYVYTPKHKGDYYEGQWQNSKQHGQGLLVYKNGERWEGEWKAGSEHIGSGVYKFPEGDKVYHGALKEGKPWGKGRLTYGPESRIIYYEGDFVEGSKRGQGVMCFKNGAVYTGEWLDGEYSGYGELTEYDGSHYEGQWKNSERCGQGKQTYKAGDDIECYEGRWDMGMKSGYGVEKKRNGAIYEGEFVNGKYHGKGKLVYEESSYIAYYDGDWENGKRNGVGIMKFKAGDSYEGQWQADRYSGSGKYIYKPNVDRGCYEGQWQNSKLHGQGVLVYKNGDRWEGEWKAGSEHTGFGTVRYTDGGVYHGAMENGVWHGKGKLTYRESSHVAYYDGEWKGGKKNGSGVMKFKSGSSYEGEWVDDEFQGYGIFTYAPNPSFMEKYEGEWINSERSGHGVLYYVGGSYFEGQWKNDLQNGPGVLYKKGAFKRSKLEGVWVNGRYDWTDHKFFGWCYSVLRNLKKEESGTQTDFDAEQETKE